MRITQETLQTLDKEIDCLEIVSIEGQRYMARLWIDGTPKLLSDLHQQTRLFRSTWEVQDNLKAILIRETVVVHQPAYNEMVGLDESPIDPMRIRLQGKP